MHVCSRLSSQARTSLGATVYQLHTYQLSRFRRDSHYFLTIRPAVPHALGRRECRFKSEWKSYGMSPSTKKGALFAHCDTCNTDFSVAHAGVNDVKKHIATSKYRDSLKDKSLFFHYNHSFVMEFVPLCYQRRLVSMQLQGLIRTTTAIVRRTGK